MTQEIQSHKQVTSRIRFDGSLEEAIRKRLRSEAIQQPTTSLPLALFVLCAIYMVVYAPIVGGVLVAFILLIAAGVVAAASFYWHYWICYKQKFTEKLKEALQKHKEMERAKLDRLHEALQDGFESLAAAKGLRALQALADEYEQLELALARRQESGPLFWLEGIDELAEQSYRQGLGVLKDALELMRTIDSSNQEALMSEIVTLEGEIEGLREDDQLLARVKLREERIALYKERLRMIQKRRLQQEQLLLQAARCEASLARTRLELAALRANSYERNVSAATEMLRETIEQVKEAQEEVKQLLAL